MLGTTVHERLKNGLCFRLKANGKPTGKLTGETKESNKRRFPFNTFTSVARGGSVNGTWTAERSAYKKGAFTKIQKKSDFVFQSESLWKAHEANLKDEKVV